MESINLTIDEAWDLIDLYRQAHPEAQNPESFIAGFGPLGLAKIIIEGEGREVVFEYVDPEQSDKVKYVFL